MKKVVLLLLLPALVLFLPSCELDDSPLSDAEIVDGLKEALRIGSENSVETAKMQDGYFGDTRIRIPWPEDAEIIKDGLEFLGAYGLRDSMILLFNRAAEDAAEQATPIFVDAITNMTITDGLNILKGSDDAATQYLSDNTYQALKTEFQPDIETSLDRVGAQTLWDLVITQYNSLPDLLFPPANSDLAEVTTTKALDGLFVLIADEELDIRQNVNARVTELLRKVFAEQD